MIVDNYEQLSKEQVLQLCRGIREDSQWLIGMVENILSITRIDNEGVKLKKTPVVLEELIGQVIFNIMENAVQHALGMTDITLHVFILVNKAVF